MPRVMKLEYKPNKGRRSFNGDYSDWYKTKLVFRYFNMLKKCSVKTEVIRKMKSIRTWQQFKARFDIVFIDYIYKLLIEQEGRRT